MTSSSRIVAVYPGSFDPVTLGHEDVARRTLRVCDHLIVAVAHSSSQPKRHLFPVAERLEMLRAVFAEEPRIECVSFGGLLVDFARRRGARFIVRGLRAVSDFEYEFQMAQMNRELSQEVETVFLMASQQYLYVSSSRLKELVRFGRDVEEFVPPAVAKRLRERLGRT